MPATLRIVVEDITTQMDTYDHIQIHRATSVDGTYTDQSLDEALVALTYYYEIEDSGGDLNKWYKYRFYNDTGPVGSAFSDPFRVDGVTRLRAIQRALEDYNAGMVMESTTAGSSSIIKTLDTRHKSTAYRDGRAKGAWIYITTGDRAGQDTIIVDSDVSEGHITVNPALTGSLTSGDQLEHHWLAPRRVWDGAFNRAMARYYYIDRVPLQGVAGEEEYDLSVIPWLIDPEQVHDVRHYPASGVDVDKPYGIGGKWWRPRWDREKVVLQIHPATTDTLYLECTRPMPPLYTDASAAPLGCAEKLVVALTYDEVLAWLSRPGNGSAEDRTSWRRQRRGHLPELRRLLSKYRPKPRYGPVQLPWPPVAPRRFVAR